MLIDAEFWRDKRVFLSGHTGFKGAWLASWLNRMEARVHGFALAPTYSSGVYDGNRLAAKITETIADIRDAGRLQRAISDFQPQIIFHLAAQPLVKYSYQHPIETFETNIMGTANLLQATRCCSELLALVVVTTDKCYLNQELASGYTEDQPLGGYDPYSSSKACADILSGSWYQSYVQGSGRDGRSQFGLATARAGNVIGGGDMAADRLVPDVLRAVANSERLEIRNPDAVRPWQYVLDPLGGYLRLAQLLSGEPDRYSGPWNFGPDPEDVQTVGWMVENLLERMQAKLRWSYEPEPSVHETKYLLLDCRKAKAELTWTPRYSLGDAIDGIVRWQQCCDGVDSLGEFVAEEIDTYMRMT